MPVQVRDKMADVKDNLPQSDVNKEFYRQNLEAQVCVRHMESSVCVCVCVCVCVACVQQSNYV